MTTSPPPRVVTVRHQGQTYTPVTAGPRMLDLAALQALAIATGEHPAVSRRFRFVLIDEMEIEGGWRFDLRMDESQTRGVKLPLVFSNSGLPIGLVEAVAPKPPGAVPGTVGACLVAEARLFDSVLADLAWTALHEGVFGGICAELDTEETPAEAGDPAWWDRRCRSEFRYVILGDRESSHYPGARVLEAWSAPA